MVSPILADRFPGLPHAAGRLGSGSDVFGWDDEVSRDHDWGLRLSLFVPADAVTEVDEQLQRLLPEHYSGFPVRFAFTGQTVPRHHVDVSSVSRFLDDRLGFNPRADPSVPDWLSLTGQAALEVVAGPVFVDTADELTSARRALDWYPHDVWRYVLACDWIRLAQELPLMGRASDVGDEIGSRIIAARLAQIAMHLAFILERRWPPYAKWLGTSFSHLAYAPELRGALDGVLTADEGTSRQHSIAAALEHLLERQNSLGLTAVTGATIPFWDRPHIHPNPTIIDQLLDGITNPDVTALPRGRGSAEQRTDNVDILINPQARARIVAI
ncbi:DUF4037 domain-containing protein [Microbacterium sulfonylureivorans]|uniref:DUF4037 domain-containing protein n=1 Tax=Microbacterium sulfonylureivorans TaxID=2486854 RepID=UPI001F0C1AAD|nr:DUF4037 domain-containing protein [Microbacterium sulfonylureivorans]